MQIAIISALILALAEPYFPKVLEHDRPVAIIIDVSASMQAGSQGQSRFEQARQGASGLIDRFGGRQIILAAAAKGLGQIFPSTDNRRLLEAYLRLIKPTYGADDWDGLVPIITAQCQRMPQIYLVSDGAQPEMKKLLKRYPQVNFVRVGGQAENVGILNFDARRSLTHPNLYQVLAVIKNYTRQSRPLVLSLEGLKPGGIRQELQLAPNETKGLTFEAENPAEVMLKARLEVADDYKPDNYAAAILPPIKNTQVLLVNVNNPYIRQAIQVIPQVQVQQLSIQQYEQMTRQSMLSNYDLAVFENYSPKIFIAEDSVIWGTGAPSEAMPADSPDKPVWQEPHPILDYINLTQFQLKQYQPVPKFEPYSRVLLNRRGLPLMVYDTYPASRILRVGFRLEDSDLALNASFPMLWLNIVRHAARQSPDKWAQLKIGEPYRLPHVSDSQKEPLQASRLLLETGKPEQVSIDASPGYYYPPLAGIYQLECGGFSAKFVAKPDPQESAVNPSGNAPPSAKLHEGGILGRVLGYLKLWHVLAMAVLGLIILEWWYQRERAYVLF